MVKTKAIEIIKTLSEAERKNFGQFLNSPYFNSNKNLTKLYGFIQKNLPNIDSDKITEELFYSKLYPAKKFSYGIMKNLMSELSGIAEKFLIINSVYSGIDSVNQKLVLLKEYDKRNLDSYFLRSYEKLEKYLNGIKVHENYFREYSAANGALCAFHQNRSNINNYVSAVLSGTEYTFLVLITILSDEFIMQFSAEHGANRKPEIDIIKEFISFVDMNGLILFVEKNDLKNKDDIIIKLKTISLFVNPGEDNDTYYQLRDAIFRNHGNYSNLMLYTMINNNILQYAEKRSSAGSAEFHEEKFRVMKKMFSLVRFNSEGVGHVFLSVYLDVVLTGIKLGETEYAASFAEKFRKEVDPSVQNVAYHLAAAYIHASNEEFEKCLAKLAKVDQTDHHIKLRTKFLYLKCYFELKMFEQGLSMVDSFRKFITETKELHPDFRRILRDSCKSYYELFRISSSPQLYTPEKIEKHENFIRNSKISSKEWHLKKLEELKTNLKGSLR